LAWCAIAARRLHLCSMAQDPEAKMASLENTLLVDYGVSDKYRFELELEFVQCLANPEYLNWLAQTQHFQNPAFLAFLVYLQYWKTPEYSHFITCDIRFQRA
jgi:hypothetical protein